MAVDPPAVKVAKPSKSAPVEEALKEDEHAKADVVHKHGIGSCRGTLVATPQGLRYDTTNKGDAFTSALTNLETFEVDYLEKNLKVKIKGGKQYNFTDPNGNADTLFVFQRDVEKARQRLLKGEVPATN